jgi:hypothetical protein
VSRGPFYGSTKYGAPIVDLALALSMGHSSYQAEEAMASMGIQISSDAVLDYIRAFADAARRKAPLVEGPGCTG